MKAIMEKNPGLVIHRCSDPAFRPYGRILDGLDTTGILSWMDTKVQTPEAPDYQRSVPGLEDLPGPTGRTWKQWASTRFYGNFPAQLGYVAGKNTKLNALEYHKSSEITIAASDFILLLGKLQDIEGFRTYDPNLVEAFWVERGMAIETYATTLHFAPVMASHGGFQAVIILPLGTNGPLEAVDTSAPGEDGLLWMTNKWLIACPDSRPASRGALVGIPKNREIVI